MTKLSAGVLGGTTLLGFFAGLLLFKVKSHWCPLCGDTLRCVACRDRARLGGLV